MILCLRYRASRLCFETIPKAPAVQANALTVSIRAFDSPSFALFDFGLSKFLETSAFSASRRALSCDEAVATEPSINEPENIARLSVTFHNAEADVKVASSCSGLMRLAEALLAMCRCSCSWRKYNIIICHHRSSRV